jgi:UDP:flavonoid glycosyltransferase YjiC (YdhE family)
MSSPTRFITHAGMGGAGVQLRTEHLNGECLRAAVDAAASRTDRVHELRAGVRSFGGTAIAADTIERLCV